MESLYQNPKYYEIAFSYRDIKAEVDTFEESIKMFSKIKVENVLELGCGNSPHMIELVKRGFNYYGIDLSKEMIEYSQEKAKEFRMNVNLIQANMIDFNIDYKIDFAYIMLGSLYANNRDELNSHFDSINNVLKSGGLYFLDWCVQFSPLKETKEEWEMEQDGISVNTQYFTSNLNRVSQTFEENILLDINDNGKNLTFLQKEIRKAIYPQEFLTFLSGRSDFEFVGWWNNWNLEAPLIGTEEISRPIIIIRKK